MYKIGPCLNNLLPTVQQGTEESGVEVCYGYYSWECSKQQLTNFAVFSVHYPKMLQRNMWFD